MNMNCCENKCGYSTKEKVVDYSNKESVVKRREEIQSDIDKSFEKQRNLYNEMYALEDRYIEMFKADLINRNIKDKCFAYNKKEFDAKSVEYFRVTKIQYVYFDTITLYCEHFIKSEYEDSSIVYKFGNELIQVPCSALDEKNEITLQEFKQKREEYFNEYKEYVQ